jgi:phosphatidylglycerol---prolipoprotein diacylglyceryl transferase
VLGPFWSALAHFASEALAYLVGARVFLAARARSAHPLHSRHDGLWVLVGAVCGAALGSKSLAWLQFPHTLAAGGWRDPVVLLGGKTIVGGLLGGWIGVEAAKHAIGLRRSTGDLFVGALILGMAIGRLGCLLAGVHDYTYGNPTTLPWGLDLGDGVRRHPTALYEIVALGALALLLRRLPRAGQREGDRFRLFVAGYLAFRFAVEWLKPPQGGHAPALAGQPSAHLWLGALTSIQVACLVGLAYASPAILRACRRPEIPA